MGGLAVEPMSVGSNQVCGRRPSPSETRKPNLEPGNTMIRRAIHIPAASLAESRAMMGTAARHGAWPGREDSRRPIAASEPNKENSRPMDTASMGERRQASESGDASASVRAHG